MIRLEDTMISNKVNYVHMGFVFTIKQGGLKYLQNLTSSCHREK